MSTVQTNFGEDGSFEKSNVERHPSQTKVCPMCDATVPACRLPFHIMEEHQERAKVFQDEEGDAQ